MARPLRRWAIVDTHHGEPFNTVSRYWTQRGATNGLRRLNTIRRMFGIRPRAGFELRVQRDGGGRVDQA